MLKENKYTSKPSKPAIASYKYVEFVIEGSINLTGKDKYVEFLQGCMNMIKNFQLVDDTYIFHTTTPGSKSRYLQLPDDVPRDITLQLDYFAVGGDQMHSKIKITMEKEKGAATKEIMRTTMDLILSPI